MAWTAQGTTPTSCPRCNGLVYQGYDALEFNCMTCGECIYVGTPLRVMTEQQQSPDGQVRRKRGRPRKVLQVA